MFGYWCSNMFGYGGSWGFSWWWLMCLIPIIFMIAICFFFMTRHAKGHMMYPWPKSGGAANPLFSSMSARDILDKRYALGEINKEEYEEKKSGFNQIGVA